MGEVSTIGLDIAKSVFQVHGVDDAGTIVMCKRINRSKVLQFFGDLSPCLVGLEACPSAHYWSRELQALGHTVKLMPPSYVKAYLKRSKNDANDAAAICEAVTRPSMRFVPIKTEHQQSGRMLHRTRQLLVRQRTMLSNAIRGHMAELGIISASALFTCSVPSMDKPRAAMARLSCCRLLPVLSRPSSSPIPESQRRGLIHRQARNRWDAIVRDVAAGGDPGHWSDCRHGPGRGDRRLGGVPIRTQSCCLDRFGAQAAFDRWQGAARQYHQAGQSLFAMAARCRRHGRHSLRPSARHQASLAHTNNGSPNR